MGSGVRPIVLPSIAAFMLAFAVLGRDEEALTRVVKGHRFGPSLSPADKKALIPFLKTLSPALRIIERRRR